MIDLACLAQRLRAHDRTLWLAGAQPHIRRLIESAIRIASVGQKPSHSPT